VKGYELRGNTLLPAINHRTDLLKHMGTLTFDTIRTVLAELQIAYRERGYVTVAASLPRSTHERDRHSSDY